MPVSQALVAAPSNNSAADGTYNPVLQGKLGEQIVSEMHGKYFTQAYRGNLYFASTALAGVTLPILSSTSPTFVLWNQSSTKILSVAAVSITPTTAATTATGYGYAFLLNAGTGVGTAAPVSAVTPITATRGPVNLTAAGQGTSVAVVASAATLTSAATIFRNNGMSAGTGAITAPAQQPVLTDWTDGTLLVPPLALMIVGTTITTSGQTATGVNVIWEEIPV